LIGRITTKLKSTPFNNMLLSIFGNNVRKDISIRAPRSITGVVTRVSITLKKPTFVIVIYVSEKRRIQIGDKVAGRHGNKGIVSRIVPFVDMPYLPDGTIVDMILNPLGIPSRMNVGQIYESLLNLAAITLKEKYQIQPFDEVQSTKTSETLVFKKLNEARKKTKKDWLFNPNFPGKAMLFDGRSGRSFEQTVAFGYAYILKLIHMVKDKIHARVTGPYSSVLQQPLRGKSNNGGQRFGEMEVWAIEGFGAAYMLQELLTIKSDDVDNRSKALSSLIMGRKFPTPNVPQAFKVFILEMQSLCFDIRFFTDSFKNFY
jgi:DNA-directed RNA polymerase subunit beta